MDTKYYLKKFDVLFGERPIYKYIDVKKYYCEEKEYFGEIIDLVTFMSMDGEEQEYEHFDLSMVGDDYKKDCVLFCRYYAMMRSKFLGMEYHFGKKNTKNEVESNPYEGTKEILSAIKKTSGLKLNRIEFFFDDEIVLSGKTIKLNDKNISFSNKNILFAMLPAIEKCITDYLCNYAIVEGVRKGQKSTYMRKWGVSLYPFFLYLKEFVFPEKDNVYMYDFISTMISRKINSFFVDDEVYMKEHNDDWEKKQDVIDRENLMELFKKKNSPPVKIILNPPYPD
ncbi:MAG: hypothetical protein RSB21_09700 [Eubacterium sp.]